MALFVTLEGGEGSGKSTQARILVERLRKEKNLHVIPVEEPGTTLLGKMLKAWLAHRDSALTLLPKPDTQLLLLESSVAESLLPDILLHAAAPRTELLAFTIARTQLVEDVILPNLKNDNIVICDRFADSTTAYQGYGRGLDLKLIEISNKIATKGLKPDLTILLDLPPKDGISRKYGTKKTDHFEQQDIAFHQKVREGYLKLAADEPERWLVIDAAQSKEKIAEIIWQKVKGVLEGRRPSS